MTPLELHAILDEATADARARAIRRVGSSVRIYAHQTSDDIIRIGLIYADVEAWAEISLLDISLAVLPRTVMRKHWSNVIDRLEKVAPLAELDTQFATMH